MKKLFFLFLLLPSLCYAQVKLDSLLSVWNDPNQADTSRLNAMDDIAWEGYAFSQPDSAFYFAQQQYDYAEQKGLKRYMAQALKTQGESFRVKGNYSKAMDFQLQAMKIYEEIGNERGIAGSLNNIGIIYDYKGEYGKAIDFYMRALKMYEELDYKRGIANTLNNIGILYSYQNDYEKTIDFYTRSMSLYEEMGNKRGIAHSLNNIGIIYNRQGNDAKAIDCYLRSLKILEGFGDQQNMASTVNNIGSIYMNQGEYSKAVDFYKQSLKIGEEIGDQQGISYSLNKIGQVYQEQGNYAKAIEFSSKALSIAQEIGVLNEITSATKNLWETNKKLGNYKTALEMYQLHVGYNDSLKSEENQKEIIRQEFKYNYEKEALADSIKNAATQKVLDAQIEAQRAELKQERTQRFALYGGVVLLLLFAGFIFNRFKQSQAQKQLIEQQKEIVEEAHKEITDSIQYAKRIQQAILPPNKLVKQYLPNSFILYKPKDVVAGDFYWMEQKEDKTLFAAADCTGHGVPGAMVSVVCNNGLNRSVREYDLTDPGKILDKTREIVISEFEKSEDDVQDGMDIALCTLEGHTLQYAGAHNPLWLIRNGELIETKANKQPIGKYENLRPYSTHTIELQKGDTIYIFSDGYVDQFGGEKGKKFMTKPLKKMLLEIQDNSMKEQRTILDKSFETWRGQLEQVDDVCMIGVRI